MYPYKVQQISSSSCLRQCKSANTCFISGFYLKVIYGIQYKTKLEKGWVVAQYCAIFVQTRPNGSTRSEDHTQMTLFLIQNEHDNFSSV